MYSIDEFAQSRNRVRSLHASSGGIMSTQENLPAIPSNTKVAFTYNGVEVIFDDDKLINLTQMWEAQGSPLNRDPTQWKKTKEGEGFIASLATSQNVAITHVFRSMRGRGNKGVWGHRQIAIAYAKYLSHEFHRFVNEAFLEWAEEKADPGLKAQRAAQAYLDRGKDVAWILERIEGICQRKSFVSTLADHNCKKVGTENPFAEATRSLSLAALGKTPSEIKKSKGLKPTARTRDHLSKHDLARLRWAESESERLVQEEAADGNTECLAIVRRAGNAVKIAIASLTKQTG
jgi:hypothetical protein